MKARQRRGCARARRRLQPRAATEERQQRNHQPSSNRWFRTLTFGVRNLRVLGASEQKIAILLRTLYQRHMRVRRAHLGRQEHGEERDLLKVVVPSISEFCHELEIRRRESAWTKVCGK